LVKIKYCIVIFIGVPHNEAYRAFKSGVYMFEKHKEFIQFWMTCI
jgi:hypothetical protein